MKALIGDIGRGSRHDGPGIRTTVFFKGCPLNCPWCHNPELIASRPEILFNRQRCIACGDCVVACPNDAVAIEASGTRLDRQRCMGCGECARVCPTKAVALVGRLYGVDQLVDILMRDRLYYETSGGGVTLSGGEPAAQMTFLHVLLARLSQERIHTVLETNGYFAMDDFRRHCLDHLDLIYFDLKIADPDLHQEITGRQNQRIWANLAELKRLRPEAIVPRIPVIPGYTATERNLRQIAARLKEIGLRRYVLLPYHPFGRFKAQHLGRTATPNLPDKSMTAESLEAWDTVFKGAQGSLVNAPAT
jgi:pyruvate formate lyase activating enzyme